jgi:hypothetical protein
MTEEAQVRFAALSGATKRMLEYVAVMEGEARYAVLRHLARVSEEDMVEDVKEAVDAGIIAVRPGEPNVYDFIDEPVREWVLSQIGEGRLVKLRARADGARRRVAGE